MVSVWASQNQLVLAQDKIEAKTNEITAIPEVLRWLDLTGCVVTIDAIGCQTEIAETIIDQAGDYVLAVKDNQTTLREDVQAAFEHKGLFKRPDHHKTINKGHGRIEVRECWAISDPDILAHSNDYKHWKGLHSLASSPPSVISMDKSHVRRAISSARCPSMPNACYTASELIGRSRMACTGCWIWLFVRMRAVSARTTPLKILPSCATSP